MSWYNIGTVTATLNSNVITGVGTAFLANVRSGDGITIAGSTTVHEVTNVASDTQLAISPVFPGTTGSGKTYAIVPVQGYVKTLADQAKQLILNFSSIAASPSSTALAAVTGVADTIPYFTASSAMVAKAASTESVGSTIAVRGASGNLTTASLELGYTGTAFTPFIDFHSGATYTDYDTRIISDTPTGVAGGGRMQYYAGGGHLFSGAGGIWENGYKVYARSTIVGAVSQSGGIPAGAIIERGSNANGEYTKFADGTLICTLFQTIAANLNQPGYGSGAYNSYIWNFPVAYSAVPSLSIHAVISGRIVLCGPVALNSTTSCQSFFWDALGVVTGSMYTRWMAVGRWF